MFQIPNQEAIMTEENEARVRQRAHAIWEAQGHPEGLATEHWRQAEAEIAQAQAAVQLPNPLASGAAAQALTGKRSTKARG
ncbi:DUF2934 domain-containing protein [Sphingobium sp. WW5]|nr:DUF2934 domain-containing protein [Sphingobium yanoikuyae]